jgi:hypothetical protein
MTALRGVAALAIFVGVELDMVQALREMKNKARAWRRGAPKRVQSDKTIYFSSLALKRGESLGTQTTI